MECLIHAERLRLIDMMNDVRAYGSLADSLSKLPLPVYLRLGLFRYDIPGNLDQFCENITYGQRLFLLRNEPNDFGVILRLIDGYYYPIVTGRKWDEQKALLFGKKVLLCVAKELYPVSMHLTKLLNELVARELRLLSREPSKLEIAAGINKLSVYAELAAVDFLRQTLNKTEDEVMLTPYNECLVRFMQAKEVSEYHERYMALRQEEASKQTGKFKHTQK